jgi:hypothetical protein
MTGRAAGVAVFAWLIGITVLGFDWHGHERSPGVWDDGVSLAQWLACWAVLAVVGMVAGRVVRGWSPRALALLPLVAWIVWQLRGSTLGPIPMVIYIVPTGVTWAAGLVIGDIVRQRLARSM